MTFSQLSHVVLEVREAIIQKVDSSIPFGSDNIVFLLGPTRAGKSTAMCFSSRRQDAIKACSSKLL